jgi:hypothetical protein
MTFNRLPGLREALPALAVATLLAACGGSGGDPVALPAEGTWELQMRIGENILRRERTSSSGYAGCGACGVGSAVEFDVHMVYTQQGVRLAEPLPTGLQGETIRYVYARVS